MGKKPKRKNLRPPSCCIFCGGGGVRGNPMSNEHLWPEWMHPYLPKIPNAKNQTAFALETARGVKITRKKPRMGHTYTKKIKAVCKKCNETWMKDIEDQARPVLIPIIQGQQILLDHERRTKLTTWITLKALIVGNDRDTTPISSKETLAAFKELRQIPPGTKIWVAHHNAFEWSAGCWARGAAISFTPKPPVGRLRNNIQTTAFGAGHLFFLACFSSFNRITLEINNPFTAKLWSNDLSDIEWPLPLLPLDGINALANVLDELETSLNVKWAPPIGS